MAKKISVKAWVEQQLAKVTPENAADILRGELDFLDWISAISPADKKVIQHHRILINRISAEFDLPLPKQRKA